MANDVVYISGLEEVKQALDQLKLNVARTATRRALLAGARVIRDDARRRVRVRSGALRRSITATTYRDRGGIRPPRATVYIARKKFTVGRSARGRVKLGAVKKGQDVTGSRVVNPRRYAHLVEFGTAPHRLRRGGEAGGKLHPGAREKPFLRPAVDSTRTQVLRAFGDRLSFELGREIAKARIKTARARRRAAR